MVIKPGEINRNKNRQSVIDKYINYIDSELVLKEKYDQGADGYFILFNDTDDKKILDGIMGLYRAVGWDVEYSIGNRDWPSGFVFKEKGI